jgi:hypothetical protein
VTEIEDQRSAITNYVISYTIIILLLLLYYSIMCSIILCHSMRCTHTMIHLTMLQGAQTPTVLRQKLIHNTCSHNFTHDSISYHHAAQNSSPHASFADPPQGSLAHPPTSLPQPAFLTQWHKKFLICIGAAQPHLVELAGCISQATLLTYLSRSHRHTDGAASTVTYNGSQPRPISSNACWTPNSIS